MASEIGPLPPPVDLQFLTWKARWWVLLARSISPGFCQALPMCRGYVSISALRGRPHDVTLVQLHKRDSDVKSCAHTPYMKVPFRPYSAPG